MKQLTTRLRYEPYVYGEPFKTQALTDEEKLEHTGTQRSNHVSALFFLLKHIEIRFQFDDEESVNRNLRHIGELGEAISEGIFGDITGALEQLASVTTFTDDKPS